MTAMTAMTRDVGDLVVLRVFASFQKKRSFPQNFSRKR
jgi:hypothetical protein